MRPGQPRVDAEQHQDGPRERGQAHPAPCRAQGQQPDPAHHPGPEHARLGAAQDDEEDDRDQGSGWSPPAPDPQPPADEHDRPHHDRHVGPGHGAQVGHARREHRVMQVRRGEGGVPDDETGNEPASVLRQRRDGHPQPVAGHVGGTEDGSGSRRDLRLRRGRERRHHAVPVHRPETAGGGDPAPPGHLGPRVVVGEDDDGRADQADRPAGADLLQHQLEDDEVGTLIATLHGARLGRHGPGDVHHRPLPGELRHRSRV